MIRNDLHTHSIHSACGMHTVLEMVQIAVSKGMRLFNISDHGKASGRRPNFSVTGDTRRLPNPVRALDGSEIRVVRGMEANILDISGNTDITGRPAALLDLISAGFHPCCELPRNGSEADNTRALVNAVHTNPIDILTHPCISTYPLHPGTVVDLSLEFGFAIEVNNTNLRLGKTNVERLEALISLGKDKEAAFVENSDGHTYYEIGENEKVEELVNRMGLDGNTLFRNRSDVWVDEFISERKALRNSEF